VEQSSKRLLSITGAFEAATGLALLAVVTAFFLR